MDNINSINCQFNSIKEKIDSLSEFLFKKEELINEQIHDEVKLENINLFKQKYSKVKNINRFLIPIIGKCNSGKSTFINYLIHQKFLEMDDDIATKFICIIRHDPNLPLPKIYQVNLKTRDTIFFKNTDENGNYSKDLYNFDEGDEIKTNDIKEYIIQKNRDLNTKSKDLRDYFLILKINIPIFNEPELAPYSNLFDLMDIPGLNETDNFHLKDLFSLFIYNIKFCFFIFDTQQYHNSNKSFNYAKSLFKENENNIIANSIFIFNKIDLPEDKELAIQSFDTFLKENLKINGINFIPCSSNQLLLNIFKFKSFLSYTEYIFNQPPINDIKSSEEHIRLNMQKDFNRKIEENFDDEINFNEDQEFEYNIFEGKMKQITNFNSILSKNDYFYYKKIFKEKIPDSNSREINEIEQDLLDKIQNSCKKSIESYINFNKFTYLMENILSELGLENDAINDIKRSKTYVKTRDIVSLKKKPAEILDSLKEILNKIKDLKNYEYLENISKECSFFEQFIKNEIKIRIPTIGCYSSGKSSLINSIIGKNILPVSTEISTNVGIIIKYTKSLDEVLLHQVKLIKSENKIENYFYFQDINGPIFTKFNNLKEVIALINNAYKYENKFVDKIILFTKKLEEINYDRFKDIIILVNNLLLFKDIENNFKNLELFFKSLSLSDKNIMSEIYNDVHFYLSSILQSKKKGETNEYLRNYKNKNEEFIFLKLTINIKLFDEIGLNDIEKGEIELIDFPGLNSGDNNLFEKSIIDPIIKCSNGFLFISKPSVNEDFISETIKSTIEKISNRKILDFSFDTFLFVLTHFEKINNLNLETKKKEIKNIIFSGDLYSSKRFNQTNFLITKFSNNFYQEYLEEQKYIKNIIDLYSYLKKEIKNITVDNIKYAKKLKKNFDDIYFNKLKNKNEYSNFHPLDNEIKKYKDILIKEINIKMNTEYENIIKEFIKKYLFYIFNNRNHEYCNNSNLEDFKNNLKMLFVNSKKSYKKTLEKSIINFFLYLQNKLEKLNDSIIYKKVNNLIEIKKNEEKKREEKDGFEETFLNTTKFIEQKINSFKNQFINEINTLVEDVGEKRRINEIDDFTLQWKNRKESLEKEIESEIADLGLKINEKIKKFSIDENIFERQEKPKYFDWKHITAHSIALSGHGVLGIAYLASSLVIPGIGYILGGGGLLIHLTIFGIKYFINKKTELGNLINSISNYSESFIDHLNTYKINIDETLKDLKNTIFDQLNDKYSLDNNKFKKEDEEKFKEIFDLFQKNIDDNFNLK